MWLRVWRVRRRQLDGVRVVALDRNGRVLLVRHSYGSDNWMPPGGGLKPGEDPVAAAAREVQEETACTLTGARLLSVDIEGLHGNSNRVGVVVGRIEGEPQVDGREIVEAWCFPLDALPKEISGALAGKLRDWAAEI
ncbi:NUDIX domain-containing protein [Novosphingobium guangzhouense]|uniref:NUDIX domain-containing protein n=1 Tax=Novosphingobium guangzhouense TaxID=1850347 RepID=UPI001FEBE480|nr:NUDIX domain-containing protein [Novosphingobium guangzhouense]